MQLLSLLQSHVAVLPQIVTYVVVEKGIMNKGEQKVSFGTTMMRVLELQRLVKRHISGRSDIEQ